MIRMPLKQGEMIQLNNCQYTIDKVIGNGATCIVYSAYYSDSSDHLHYVNIKECYPYNIDIIRQKQELRWSSAEDKNRSITAFHNAYDKVMLCQNGNFTVHAFDFFENNNTAYIIMDANDGVTFDKDSADSIVDVLKTVKLLAHVVGEYHKNGYLHLDIKPSNFLVYPRPSEHIVLFDMDTVTSIKDIKGGTVSGVSYSDGWAAPEQKQGKINKLCPATDIFSIGAILFEKIMGRQVEVSDFGVFADWEFEGEKFEEINPKIKRLLRNIFKKTLSANIKRRYKSADLLIKDLEEAIKVASSDVYLEGDDISCSGYFVGRENELKLIKESFDNNKKAVFLHGFGGIGKTELARKYAEINSKNYDTILFLKYNGNESLQNLIADIDIVNFDTVDNDEKLRKVRSLLDKHTLVIVDNFDVEIGTDNGLKVLFDTKAHIIVATRTDFSSVYNGDKYTYIEVIDLASDDLEQVFITNAKIDTLADNEKEVLNKIFKLIENHTYATELLARQMYYSGWSIDTLYEKVKLGFASLSSAEKIVTNKDENTKKDNSLNILRAIYRLSDLTKGQKQVLMNMSLLSFVNLTKVAYAELTYSDTLNDFNTLIEIGYIQKSQGSYSLHTITKQMVFVELNPEWNNCSEVYYSIAEYVDWFGEASNRNEADKAEALQRADFLSKFFRSIDLNDYNNYGLAIFWLKNVVNSTFIISGPKWNKIKFYDLLASIREKTTTTSTDNCLVYEVLYNIATRLCDYEFWGSEKINADDFECRQKLRTEYFELLWNSCVISEKIEKLEELSYHILREINLPSVLDSINGLFKFMNNEFNENESIVTTKKKANKSYIKILELVHKYRPDYFNLYDNGEFTYYGKFWASKTYRDFIMTNDDKSIIEIPLEIMMKSYEEWCESYIEHDELPHEDFDDPYIEDEEYNDAFFEKIHEIKNSYKISVNKREWITSFVDNEDYSIEQRLYTIDDILDDFFAPFKSVTQLDIDHTVEYNKISKYDWENIELLLKIQFELYDEYLNVLKNNGAQESEFDSLLEVWFETVSHQTIYYAYMDDPEFYSTAKLLIEGGNALKRDFLKDGHSDIGDRITDVAYACWNMHKCCYIVPLLEEQIMLQNTDTHDIENLENYVRAQYSDFERLYEFSIKALSEEMSESIKDQLEESIVFSSAIMKKIRNEKFDLKPDTEE